MTTGRSRLETYVANPPLIPLVQASDAANILVVQVTPAKSDRLPKTQREIVKRLDQINFNSTLNAEIEALKGRDERGRDAQAAPPAHRPDAERVRKSASDLRAAKFQMGRSGGRDDAGALRL